MNIVLDGLQNRFRDSELISCSPNIWIDFGEDTVNSNSNMQQC